QLSAGTALSKAANYYPVFTGALGLQAVTCDRLPPRGWRSGSGAVNSSPPRRRARLPSLAIRCFPPQLLQVTTRRAAGSHEAPPRLLKVRSVGCRERRRDAVSTGAGVAPGGAR